MKGNIRSIYNISYIVIFSTLILTYIITTTLYNRFNIDTNHVVKLKSLSFVLLITIYVLDKLVIRHNIFKKR